MAEKTPQNTDALGRQTGKPESPYAYTITDKTFGEFNVLNTANAWWLEKLKVHDLISALKYDCQIKEACSYAGISVAQWKYFNELHPDFSAVEDMCRQQPTLKARRTVVDALEDPDKAFRYLERKRRKEFGNSLDVTTEGDKVTGFVVEIVEPKQTPPPAPVINNDNGKSENKGDASVPEKPTEQGPCSA